MVNLYVDLVLKRLRSIEDNEDGIPLVPLFLREDVRKVIEVRENII